MPRRAETSEFELKEHLKDLVEKALHDLAAARERTVVLLGHEHRGVPDDVLAGADERVEIPMLGHGGSLNVAVAGSLVAYRLSGLA